MRPTRPRWVNSVPRYCCPFLYLRMCLSTVTERVPLTLGRAGPEFAPVPGDCLGPRASTGLARFMKFWVIEIKKSLDWNVCRGAIGRISLPTSDDNDGCKEINWGLGCRRFGEIVVAGCDGWCHFDIFRCAQQREFYRDGDISGFGVVLNPIAVAIWI